MDPDTNLNPQATPIDQNISGFGDISGRERLFQRWSKKLHFDGFIKTETKTILGKFMSSIQNDKQSDLSFFTSVDERLKGG